MELLIVLLLLLGPCASNDTEDLFCEGDGCDALADATGGGGEGGTGASGEGGAGGEEPPPPCECDDGNSCNGVEGCAADGSCVQIAPPSVTVDESLCTLDYCENGEEQHPPIDVDDGIDCTIDGCDPNRGPWHTTDGPDCKVD